MRGIAVEREWQLRGMCVNKKYVEKRAGMFHKISAKLSDVV